MRFGQNLKEAAKSANNYGKTVGLTAGVAALVPGGQVAAPELGALSAISFGVGGVLDIFGSTIIAVETGNYRGYVYDATSAVFGQITGTGHAGADAAASGMVDTMSSAARTPTASTRRARGSAMTREKRSVLVIGMASAVAVAANLYRVDLILGWVALFAVIIGCVIVWKRNTD